MEYWDGMKAIAPELWLTGFALLALLVDLLTKGRNSRTVGYVTLAGLGVTALALMGQSERVTAFGMVEVDAFGRFFKLFTLAALAVVCVFVMSDRRERQHGIGEYYFLLLGAAVGIFFMVSTNNLLLLVLGLELLSLASYSLAGFHKGNKASAEAALKYVIFGGLSAGVMIFGISLLYGLTGTIDLAEMATLGGEGLPRGLVSQLAASPIPVGIAVTMVLAGFAYKISAVPFHFWTPDVYQGAPTPVTTFLAVASKAAGFGALLRFLGVMFVRGDVQGLVADYGGQVGLLIAVLAAITMTVGNVSALGQSSLKRLLAFSSVAHAGYLLMGVATMNNDGFSAALYYMAAYYFMNLGAFGVVLYFEGVNGNDHIDSLKGLGRKAPLVSIVMVAFLVSLTGLPPTMGYYGKFLLFTAAIDNGMTWLAVIAGLNSAISLFYYFRIAKALFLKEPSDESVPRTQPIFTGMLTAFGVCTVLFGLYVSPIMQWVVSSMDLL
ncbi:MAG: NADH-quinone oxidoreductase subunit N, partial [Planctomycetes bacterium]|nr:NADH-quinone oxidoreductase subunit N [Planctomycetota bacterium]